MQIELLQKWITQGTEPMISPDYPKIDWSKEIIRIFGTDEIINPSELSASLNDLAYELISFEWWFFHATKGTYSIMLINDEVKQWKTNFRDKLITQYKWVFDDEIKRIKRNAPDKLSRYIDLWESRMQLCELSPNNVLYNGIFIPMIEHIKNGEDFNPIPINNQLLTNDLRGELFHYPLDGKHFLLINDTLFISNDEKLYTLWINYCERRMTAMCAMDEVNKMDNVEIINDQSRIDYYESLRTFEHRNIFFVFCRSDKNKPTDTEFKKQLDDLCERAINLLKHYSDASKKRMLINNMIDTIDKWSNTKGLTTNKKEAIEFTKQQIKKQLTEPIQGKSTLPVIDCDKYDSDKIYETFGTGLFFTCTKKVFDDWFVIGIGNKIQPKIKRDEKGKFERGVVGQIKCLLGEITGNPEDTKMAYFKKVFAESINSHAYQDAKPQYAEKLNACRKN